MRNANQQPGPERALEPTPESVETPLGTADLARAEARAERERVRAERRCIVTNLSRPKDKMIRFVLGPDGVVPDLARRLPGRGVWITDTRADVDKAVRKNAFARAFRQQVDVPAGLASLIATLTHRRCLSTLSMAKKAGNGVTGYSKVESTLRDGTAMVLLHASDGAEDGCRKLDGLARVGAELFDTRTRIVTRFTSDELSLAFGRSNVVHAALTQSGVSASFLNELTRLEEFAATTGDADDPASGDATPDLRCTEIV